MERADYLSPIRVNGDTLTGLETDRRYPIQNEPKPLARDSFWSSYLLQGVTRGITPGKPWDPDATIVFTDKCRMKIFGEGHYASPTYEKTMTHAEREYDMLLAATSSRHSVPTPLALVELYRSDGSKMPAILEEFVSEPHEQWTVLSVSDLVVNAALVFGPPFSYRRLKFAASIGLRLCDILADIHSCGIVIRNLKPDNTILCIRELSADPDVRHVMILDLDSASFICMPDRADLQKESVAFASGSYGAPEVFDCAVTSDGDIVSGGAFSYRSSPSVDLWSLGAILYYVITGEPPMYTSPYRPAVSTSYNEEFRLNFMWPKRDGLRIPIVDDPEPGAWPLLIALQGIVRRCTEYDPRERLFLTSVDGVRISLRNAIEDAERHR